MRTIFAFEGSDGYDLLTGLAPADAELLALDLDAQTFSRRHGLPSASFGEWFDRHDRLRIAKTAEGLAATFSSIEGLTFEGLSFPSLDREALRWFWLEIATALAYIDRFRSEKIDRVLFKCPSQPRPMLYYDGARIVQQTWRGMMPDLSVPLLTHERFRPTVLRQLVARVLRRRSTFPRHEGRWALVLGVDEIYRIRAVLRELDERQHEDLVLVLRGGKRELVEEVARETGMLVLPAPMTRGLSARVRLPRWADVCPRDGLFGAVARTLPGQFEFLIEDRWPRLVSQLEAWIDFLRQVQPEGVILSGLDDADSRIVTIAAREESLTSVVLPHGQALAPGNNNSDADVIVVGSPYQEAVFVEEGVSPERMLRDSRVWVNNEYRVDEEEARPTAPQCILVLVHPPAYPGLAALTVDPEKQVQAVLAVKEACEKSSDHLEVKLKLHPSGVDRAFYASRSSIASLIADAGTSLDELLGETAVVVGVNYCGSALFPCLARQRPLIQYWNDECFGLLPPYEHAHLFAGAGPIVRTRLALEQELKRLLDDGTHKEAAIRRSREFAASWIHQSAGPSFIEQLKLRRVE